MTIVWMGATSICYDLDEILMSSSQLEHRLGFDTCIATVSLTQRGACEARSAMCEQQSPVPHVCAGCFRLERIKRPSSGCTPT